MSEVFSDIEEKSLDVRAADLKVGDMLRGGLLDRWTVRGIRHGALPKKVAVVVDNRPIGNGSATSAVDPDSLVSIYRVTPKVTGLAAIIERAEKLRDDPYQRHNLGGVLGDQTILSLVIQLAQELS